MQTNFLALTILYTNILLTHILLLEAQPGILNMLLIPARPQRQTNANECRILGDLDQLKSKDTMQKTVD